MSKQKLTASNIADASTVDIIKFAEVEAGLHFAEDTSRDFVIEQLFEALAWMRKDPTEGATHVVLKIAHSPDTAGMHDVRLGHNGRMMTLKREKETEVPIEFYNVLQDINSLGFEIPALDKEGRIRDESPTAQRIQRTKYPVVVMRFINKGKAA